jgi:hypothetical protein
MSTRPSKSLKPYRLTTAYSLEFWEQRKRFEEFRAKHDLPPYFQEADGAEAVIGANAGLIDIADTDEITRAFLDGLDAKQVEALRLPWDHPVTSTSYAYDPKYISLTTYFSTYTIWRGSHALFQAEHYFLALIGNIMARVDTTILMQAASEVADAE